MEVGKWVNYFLDPVFMDQYLVVYAAPLGSLTNKAVITIQTLK